MIKFRQKEYSKAAVRFVRGVKKAANRVDTGFNNELLKIHGKLGIGKVTKNLPESVRRSKLPVKTDLQLDRETIKSVKGDGLGKTMLTPTNRLIDRGISTAIESPMTGVGFVTPVPGGTFAGNMVDDIAKYYSPRYEKALSGLKKRYDSSKFSKSLRGHNLPTPQELIKSIPVVI